MKNHTKSSAGFLGFPFGTPFFTQHKLATLFRTTHRFNHTVWYVEKGKAVWEPTQFKTSNGKDTFSRNRAHRIARELMINPLIIQTSVKNEECSIYTRIER